MKKKFFLWSIAISILVSGTVSIAINFAILGSLIEVNRYIVGFSQGGEEYEMRCDNSVIDQIVAVLPDLPEDKLANDCIEIVDKQGKIDLKITMLAGKINEELSGQPIFGWAHSYGKLENFSLESITKCLAEFIIDYRIAVGQKFPDKNRLVNDIAHKIVKEHKLRRGV